MKNRLQTLWDEVAPEGGACPRPDVKQVQRRVDAVLDGKRRVFHPQRALRAAALAAAVLLLLTGAAAAAVELILPEYNVLSVFFGRGENAPGAEELVNTNPISVSDDNYTMTVTTSMADGNTIYFTLLVEAKTARAMTYLSDEGFRRSDGVNPLVMKVSQASGGAVYGGVTYDYGGYDAAAHTRRMNIEARVNEGDAARVSVRLSDMEEDLWLTFPVEPIRTVTLEINAEGQGMCYWLDSSADGPVTLERVRLSPLSYQAKYTSDEHGRYPLVYFLWKDGSVTTMRQMGVDGPGSGTSTNGGPFELIAAFNFDSIQDISQMEAVVFEGVAYPLDGGQPYEVDLSGYPLPFSIPIEPMEEYPYFSFPLFALCDGLGASCRWDARAGAAAVSFRGVTATFTLGSKAVLLEGARSGSLDMGAAPVYRDGDLWVDGGRYLELSGAWKISLRPSPRDGEALLERDWTSLTVIP